MSQPPAFASAMALASDWRGALAACLERIAVPAGANLGFVYWSDRFNREADQLISRLRERTGIPHWVGSAAIGLIGNEGAQIDAPGISLLVGRFPEGSFRVFSGRKPLAAERDFVADAAIVHADPGTPDMPDLIRDMAGKLGRRRLAGGLVSGRESSLMLADTTITGGISGVAFDRRVAFVSDLSQGCRPLGPPREATEIDENLIGKLDGRPALAVYRDTVGPVLADDLRRAARSVMVALVSPEDPSHYLVRQVIGIDPAGGRLAISDLTEEGQEVMFVRRDADTAAQDLATMLERLRGRCSTAPRAALYVSCAGRGGQLFERDDSELEAIQNVFGGLPITGYFAAGEILDQELFGFTGVLTLFC